jgi:flavin reductase (DIM6/NTAB) family NADH-FMN oxidoreductase RutF
MLTPTPTQPPTTDDLRRAFGHYPSGVAAIAATVDGTDEVLVASSFTVGVSMEPPLVLFAVQHTSTTWPVLARATRLGISVLSSAQQHLCRQLAGRDKTTRWAGVNATRHASGAVTIDGAAIDLECTVAAVHPAGDHDIIVFRVETIAPDHSTEPLVFHGSQFRALA